MTKSSLLSTHPVLLLQPNYTAITSTCNIWRNFDDIQDSWSSVASVIDYYGDNQDVIIANAGPGHWNDPDMVTQRTNHDQFVVLELGTNVVFQQKVAEHPKKKKQHADEVR